MLRMEVAGYGFQDIRMKLRVTGSRFKTLIIKVTGYELRVLKFKRNEYRMNLEKIVELNLNKKYTDSRPGRSKFLPRNP